MKLARLRRSTPIRLAVAFAGLFSLAIVAVFMLLYWHVGRDLDRYLQTRLLETRDTLDLVGRRDGIDGLTEVVASESASIRDADAIFLLKGTDGSILAGNTGEVADFQGFRLLERASIPAMARRSAAEDEFLAAWHALPGGGRLLVGLSDAQKRAAQHSILAALGWGLFLSFALAIGTGAFLAARASRRMAAFARALGAVSRGRLDYRVPLSRRGDDLDRIGAQLNDALDQLESLVERVKHSSTDIAHDLKTPMARMRQRLESMAAEPDLGERQRDELGAAAEEADRIVAIIDALLRIGQIEAGARKSRFAPLSLADLVTDVAEIYAPVAEEAGQTLELHIDGEAASTVLGDRELLTQAIANLVENAIRHCPAATRIGVALASSSGGPVLRVADTGPGIASEQRAQVLERFHRLDASRSTPGNGLGLSLVSAIADLHGARLSLADNKPGLLVTLAFRAPPPDATAPAYRFSMRRPSSGNVSPAM